MLLSAPLKSGMEPKHPMEKRTQHLCVAWLSCVSEASGASSLFLLFVLFLVLPLSLFLNFDADLTLCNRLRLAEPLTCVTASVGPAEGGSVLSVTE